MTDSGGAGLSEHTSRAEDARGGQVEPSRRRGGFTALLPVSLAAIVTAAAVVPLPVFVENPQDPVSLDERVVVEIAGAAVDGDYLLLAVSLRRGTFMRVLHGLVDDDRTIVADTRIVPPHEDDATYFARQRDVFSETAVVAAAVGLEAAGYPAHPEALTGEGVLVVDVVTDTPAADGLEPGDVIVEADGVPVRAFDDLRAALPLEVGTPVELVVMRDEAMEHIALRTAELETAEGRRPGLGIIGQTHEPRLELPVPVNVEGGRIGGPSAGLVIALTVYDKAARDVDLAAGRRIAATGRIDQDGRVGGVGGIRQKVVAAGAAGADVLLVPAGLLERAEEARPAGSDLEILGVGTFGEAIEALRDGRRSTASDAAQRRTASSARLSGSTAP